MDTSNRLTDTDIYIFETQKCGDSERERGGEGGKWK